MVRQAEWPCVQGWGIFDGPTDDAAVSAITSWRPNTVRVPLNEHCWLGINGVPAEFGGANFSDRLTAWASSKGIGWLAWGWYPGDCGFPGLITDWNGTPSGYGAGVRDRLLN